VAILDGPVDLSHECFDEAPIGVLETLVMDPVGDGPMSAHGTHIASLIFGQPDSSVIGIAPRCRGFVAPVFRDRGDRPLSQLDLARVIEQSVQAGAHVINISGGQLSPEGQADEILQHALRLCEDSNVLVVSAVGNDGCSCLHVPAAISSVLAVGALGADGKPLESSNWGDAYRSNGILAPGEKITGAAPGGGTAALTGSSFATAIVSAVAALLLSVQLAEGRPPDPRAVGEALYQTALACQPEENPACRRYLAGVLNIPGAYSAVTKRGRTVVTSTNLTEVPDLPARPLAAEADTVPPGVNGAGIVAACSPAVGPGGVVVADGLSCSSAVPPAASPAAAIAGGCACGDAKKSYIFAIGTIGFDFGTEARRDTFRQLMPSVGEPPTVVPPNPYDVMQLADYLDSNRSECTKLIWTMNLDLTPIYVVEAEPAYAEDVYTVLRSALRNEALPADDENFVSRVSIPGVLTGRTRRLFSGQVVPVVIAQPRGLYVWNETRLVNAIVDGVLGMQPDTSDGQPDTSGASPAPARGQVSQTVRAFLDKVYYQFRNLGQNSADRALNFAATNAFIFADGVRQGMLSAQNVPGGQNLYTLDTISVTKSPYCRMDSDCWDVQVSFFDPENDRRARAILQYTIDVSDELPVSLAPTRQFLVAS
jgi:cyanobactin maturation PatA/PatG family protease